MGDDLGNVERRLAAGFRVQLGLYQRALQILEQASGEATSGWAQELNAVLAECSALEASLAVERTAWRKAGRRPGPELGALLSQAAQSLRELSGRIDARIEEVQARKQNLLPEMDAFIQRRRMLHAYAKSR